MGMQGEMSPAGTGGLFFRVLSSDEHPPPPRWVCVCLSVFGCVVFADGSRNDRLCSMGM